MRREGDEEGKKRKTDVSTGKKKGCISIFREGGFARMK